MLNKHFSLFLNFAEARMAIGSDWKQFFSSDPTKNKNESDSIRRKKLKIAFNSICFNSFKQYVNLI